MSPLLSRLTAFTAGALSVLAYAPFGWWPLQTLTLAVLFYLLLRAPRPRDSAILGWAYSSGWLIAGTHWLYISLHQYGGMAAPLAAFAVVLLAVLLALLVGTATGLTAWLQQRWSTSPAVTLLLILPTLFMLAEWTRSWVFTGFPWVSSGYAHTTGPLAGYAPLLGVYGIGWLGAMVAAGLVLLPQKKAWVALPLALLAGGYALQQVQWTQPAGKPISVRLLQPNVPQEMKFDAQQVNLTLSLLDDLIRAAPADLVATPETALPMLLQQLPQDYLPRLASFAADTGSHIALGVPISDNPQQYANSVLGIGPATATKKSFYRYDKHHLVPFGEFVPPGFRWFVDLMHIPLGDFSRGSAVQPAFAVKDQWVLPNICYEDLFGEEIAEQLAAAHFAGQPVPTMLLNMSNIAWFGDSIALPQHLQISQMRTLETGRPMLRATNTGATAVVRPDGTVQAQLPAFEGGVLTTSVQGYAGLTPYIVYGNWVPVSLACSMLLVAWLRRRRVK